MRAATKGPRSSELCHIVTAAAELTNGVRRKGRVALHTNPYPGRCLMSAPVRVDFYFQCGKRIEPTRTGELSFD